MIERLNLRARRFPATFLLRVIRSFFDFFSEAYGDDSSRRMQVSVHISCILPSTRPHYLRTSNLFFFTSIGHSCYNFKLTVFLGYLVLSKEEEFGLDAFDPAETIQANGTAICQG
jgi:hypothetical protein